MKNPIDSLSLENQFSKSDAEKLLKAQIKAAESASKEGESEKQKTEFTRYKQDCRKRALDVASSIKTIEAPTQEYILKEASKYYNWLISIPQ